MMPRPGSFGMEQIEPALYVVWRRIEKGGAYHYREAVCVNPAYGYRLLDEWEADVRTRPVVPPPARDHLLLS